MISREKLIGSAELPHHTKVKISGRVPPYDKTFRVFPKFPVHIGFYWDYDMRRLNDKTFSFWPLHNASFANTDPQKYFEVVITDLTPKIKSCLRKITSSGVLTYNFEDINTIVNENLLDHELTIDSDPVLLNVIVSHTGATLDLDTHEGKILSTSRSPGLKSNMVVWRALSKPFGSNGKNFSVGDRGQVEGSVWSTSYNPISSYGYAMAAETENHPNVYMLKILVPKGFSQGWFVENSVIDDTNYTFKEQFEYSIFGGTFSVLNYYEEVAKIPDSAGNITPVFTRFYEIVMD